jgi:inosine-uridine nucleoside N-ribohydrolase
MSVEFAAVCIAQDLAAAPERPVPLIFDTDIGNDVDDALALGVIHALQSRGECELLAVTITKDHELCAPFVDLVNTFYGRGNIPIGVVKDGPTPEDSKFLELARTQDDGTLRYPHDLTSSADAPDATTVLRKALAGAEDNSVVIAQVGFSTNLARLLASGPDDISGLSGRDLAAKKVRLISIMAGAFEPLKGKVHREYNVVKDIASAQALADGWPTPIVYSGYEIGVNILYPAASIERDFAYVDHHPMAEAYQAFMPTPHERPTWDLTSVLWAVRPERGYLDLSATGTVRVTDDGVTEFVEAADGNCAYLIASDAQKVRTKEALVQLTSQPPDAR